jgi:hypothetical protein
VEDDTTGVCRPSSTRGHATPYAAGIEEEADEMLNGDVAKYRTQDMLRSSEAHRASRSLAKKHAERRNRRIRTTASGIAALVTFPIHR